MARTVDEAKKVVHPKCRANYPQLELKISYNPLV